MARFAIEESIFHKNIVDNLQPKPNGPGVIAWSHDDSWAQAIAAALNLCHESNTLAFPPIKPAKK